MSVIGRPSRSSSADRDPAARRIKDLPADLRPRERMLAAGASALSAGELIAVLLGSGSRRRSALALATELLCRYGSLERMAAAAPAELAQTPGVGEVKALHLLAAFELGRRLAALPAATRPAVRTPADAARLLMADLRHAETEGFWVLLLNAKHEVLDRVEVSRGGLTSSPVHPREVFKAAIRRGAAGLILVHNHPSGDPSPSRADLAATARLGRAAGLVGIPIIDHIIIGDGRFVSLRERGARLDGAHEEERSMGHDL